MRLSALASLGIGLAAFSLALTGCATAVPEAAPAASSTPTPTPTPTVEPIVIGPAEMPPVVFDGDCEEVLSVDDLAEVIGVDFAPDEFDFAYHAAVGELVCQWRGPDREGVLVSVIPKAGLDGAEIPAEAAAFYFEECRWSGGVCSWQGDDDSLWVGISFWGIAGMVQEGAARWGADLGPRILENEAVAVAEPWVRDRAGWWPAMDCATIADSVRAQLGATLQGESGSVEPSSPGSLLVERAIGHSDCALRGPDGGPVIRVMTWPGMGGVVPTQGAESVDSGVPGISMLDYRQTDPGGTEGYFRLSDGVNAVEVMVSESILDTPHEIATAVAAAAASDFE